MTGAMYAAVAGLKTHMSAMNVIGNNIANVNTNAFKASSYTFKESLYTTSRGGSDGTTTTGGVNPAQIGYGCSVGSIDMDMSTKNYSPTGRELDITIIGDGFLMVGDKDAGPFSSDASLKNLDLERLGRLKFDSQGYLTDDQGRIVYGFAATAKNENGTNNATCELSPVLVPLRIPYMTATTKQNGQDENGNPITTTKGGYVLYPTVDSAQNNNGTTDNNGPIAGTLTYPKSLDELNDNNNQGGGGNGGTADPDVEGQIALLDTISISKDGVITAVIKESGQAITIGQIAMGIVDNPEGLTHTDGRYFRALDGAGNVYAGSIGGLVTNTFTQGAGGNGGAAGTGTQMRQGETPIKKAGDMKTISGGLESSGTDLASEISNMILMQRGYQANTRIITVTDTMLEELVNMKR